jgi:hypothetical protein
MNELKITVEFTVNNTQVKINQEQVDEIKIQVEHLLNNPELAQYLHTLGIYHDAEVVEVSKSKNRKNISYDTRQ